MEMEADFVPVKICPECKKEFKTSYHVFLHYIKGHHRHQTYWYSSFQLGSCYTITLADGAIITKEDGEVILKKFIGNGNFDAPLFNFKRFFQFKSSVDVSFESSQSVDANSTSVRSSIENLEPVDVLNQNYFFDLEMFVFSNIPTVASASKTYSTLDETILSKAVKTMFPIYLFLQKFCVISVASGFYGVLAPLPQKGRNYLSPTS